MVNIKWDKSSEDRLIELFKAGHTLSEIARTLGTSRNAISGKINRLRKARPNDIPAANNLTKDEISVRSRRTTRSPAKKKTSRSKQTPSLKPTDPPIPFNQLEKGQCSFCVEAPDAPAHAGMLCCGAPVIDRLAREGDRRASHCQFHYEAISDRSSSAKRHVKYTNKVPTEHMVSS